MAPFPTYWNGNTRYVDLDVSADTAGAAVGKILAAHHLKGSYEIQSGLTNVCISDAVIVNQPLLVIGVQRDDNFTILNLAPGGETLRH